MSDLTYVQTQPQQCTATRSSSTGTWVCHMDEHGDERHYYVHE